VDPTGLEPATSSVQVMSASANPYISLFYKGFMIVGSLLSLFFEGLLFSGILLIEMIHFG